MDRNSIDKKYKWDLSKIYEDNLSYRNDILLVKDNIYEIKKYNNKEINGKNLYLLLDLVMSTSRVLDKLEVYVSLLCDEDMSINKNQELKEEVSNLCSLFISETYFVDTNILKLDYKDVEEFYKMDNRLFEYEKMLIEMFRFKKYTLSDELERLLANLTKTFNNNYDTYELLKDSDMTFPSFRINNKVYKLDNNKYSIYMEDDNREIRSKAFKTLYKKYKELKNVFANLLVSHVKEDVSISKIRGYNSSLEKSLYKDELSYMVYDNLITTINDRLDVLHKYYDLKKRVLDVSELHIYDVYANMVSNSQMDYSFDKAVSMVVEALGVLGDDYITNLKKGINDRWIDVYPNKGKRTGGYSSGSYDTNPYILLNYQDKYDDMSTLAHELGHSMHSYYTRDNNPYQYGHYAIFVAEVASTVNELLLSKYVINNSNDDNEKLFILNRLLELFRATIYRQTMFSTFEKTIYDYVSNDKPLTADIISDIYYELNKKYFGSSVCIDDEIRYEWERIPHFYYNFYVYKYATGLSAACYIVNGIIDGKIKVQNYIEFLKCGKTKNPLDSLKVAGVDLTDKNVIDSAVDMFNDTIDEFTKLYNKINQ